MTLTVEKRITAFLEEPDPQDADNAIHLPETAQDLGYSAALVPGTTAYAWAVPAIREALGEAWLDEGWIDVSFRRPVYPGDELRVQLRTGEDSAAEFVVANEAGAGVLSGSVGLGHAPWFAELQRPRPTPPAPRSVDRRRLTPENLPVGQDIPSMAASASVAEATEYVARVGIKESPRWTGKAARLHPGWLASRATRLIEHSYQHYPALHARSQIQHCGAAMAGQGVVVSGRIVEGYERKGHEYMVLDCWIAGEDGQDLVAHRQTAIYRPASRGPEPDRFRVRLP